MIVAVAAVVACCISTVAFAELVKSLIRSQARERDLLVNQILHLSGRTWTPPPAEQWTGPAEGEPLVQEWTVTPEQQPYL